MQEQLTTAVQLMTVLQTQVPAQPSSRSPFPRRSTPHGPRGQVGLLPGATTGDIPPLQTVTEDDEALSTEDVEALFTSVLDSSQNGPPAPEADTTGSPQNGAPPPESETVTRTQEPLRSAIIDRRIAARTAVLDRLGVVEPPRAPTPDPQEPSGSPGGSPMSDSPLTPPALDNTGDPSPSTSPQSDADADRVMHDILQHDSYLQDIEKKEAAAQKDAARAGPATSVAQPGTSAAHAALTAMPTPVQGPNFSPFPVYTPGWEDEQDEHRAKRCDQRPSPDQH